MQEIIDHSDERTKMKDEIKQLESVYHVVEKPRLDEVKLDEIEYFAPSDEYLKMGAEKSLADYKSSGEKAIRDKSAAEAKELAEKRDEYAKGRDDAIDSLRDDYERSARAIDYDALKRGLARSSIAVNNKSELEKEYLKANAEIASGYGKKLTELDAEIASTDGKLKAALADFNLTYATKLNEKLEKLKTERDQKTEAVIKYNNEVRKDQAKLDEDRARAEASLYSSALNAQKKATELGGLSADERNNIYRGVYEKMDAFLGAMEPREANAEIRKDRYYRDHLSDYYYYKLFDKYGRAVLL